MVEHDLKLAERERILLNSTETTHARAA
jgi:hypothetical protein